MPQAGLTAYHMPGKEDDYLGLRPCLCLDSYKWKTQVTGKKLIQFQSVSFATARVSSASFIFIFVINPFPFKL